MKAIGILLLLALNSFYTEKNVPVEKLDIKKYAGTWYSLYSIPTIFDKGSRETTTKYTLNSEGYYTVLTTYKKLKDEKIYSRESKMYPSNTGSLKAQFVWPIKVDYLIIELAEDYSYVVVGHPERKFLFIMSRNKFIPKQKYERIIVNCKAKGYAVEQLTSQMH